MRLLAPPQTVFVRIHEGMAGPDGSPIPMAFGDFKAGYLINDRIGTRVLRDPFTNKPYVIFYVAKRVGGGVLIERNPAAQTPVVIARCASWLLDGRWR
ncbi:phage major capsid protein [Sphingomonas sp. LY54]|nr:phage major capsid protein [Sphingomonas sp. LY54]WRP29759.1 phage major capsid protein [Sphingomonas sp. LY54]